MDLQIEIELPAEPAPTYRLSLGGITAHFREVMSLLDAHGISQEQAAVAVGLSPTTLTAYGRGYGTPAWRQVPAVTLDRLRDLAVDAYWRAAASPYRAELAEAFDGRTWLIPVWDAVGADYLVHEHHPHPLRAQEVADKLGGWIEAGWSVRCPKDKPPSLDPSAALRSRWRQSARRVYMAFGDDTEDAAAFLCAILDCCRYSLWQYSTEYRPWQLQVSLSHVLELEAACADLEVGDEVQPYESAVRAAIAELEDF